MAEEATTEGMTNEDWLKLDIKVATPNPKSVSIPSVMSQCFCGEPIVSVMGEPYGHAMTGKAECEPNGRLSPPE